MRFYIMFLNKLEKEARNTITPIRLCMNEPFIKRKSVRVKKMITKMRIKDIREDSDITQQQIAEYLHIKQNTYSQYENGHRQIPIDFLIKLARYYNTSIDYLLGETNEKRRYP